MRSKEFRNHITNLARSGLEITPRCQHAVECGGCAFQDRAYTSQVAAKTRVLRTLWADGGYGHLPLDVVPSPDSFAYRTRMDYVATKGRFGLRKRGKFNYVIDLQECHLIPPSSFDAAKALWLHCQKLSLPDYNMRSHEGFLRYIVVRRAPTTGDGASPLLLAAVTAAGPYDAEMEDLARVALLQPDVVSFHWLLNDTVTDMSLGTPVRHWGAALLPMTVGPHTLQIGPNTFFQNNIHLLQRLLDDVQTEVERGQHEAHTSKPVADLYGGVGTIALHLAPVVESIVTVEAVAESGELAQLNIAANRIGNVESVTADVLLFLRDQAPDAFDVVVVDPPRTGLGPEVCAEFARIRPRRIVYVSCNPLTQLEDVRMLADAYTLVSLRGYDMFPHTPHIEALGILERR